MMDQEEEEAEAAKASTSSSRKTPIKATLVSKLFQTNSNKESPV